MRLQSYRELINRVVSKIMILESRKIRSQSHNHPTNKFYSEGDQFHTEKNLKSLIQNLSHFHLPKNCKYITLLSFKLLKETIENEKFNLEMIFGDIEFLFSTCIFLSMKLLEDHQKVRIKEFEDYSGVNSSLILQTEKYIIFDVLEFKVIYTAEEIFNGFEEFKTEEEEEV